MLKSLILCQDDILVGDRLLLIYEVKIEAYLMLNLFLMQVLRDSLISIYCQRSVFGSASNGPYSTSPSIGGLTLRSPHSSSSRCCSLSSSLDSSHSYVVFQYSCGCANNRRRYVDYCDVGAHCAANLNGLSSTAMRFRRIVSSRRIALLLLAVVFRCFRTLLSLLSVFISYTRL